MAALRGDPDILRHIFNSLHMKPFSLRPLTVAMRVNKAWCRIGQDILYTVVELNLGMSADMSQPRPVIRLMKTLDNSQSCATAVRHLVIKSVSLHSSDLQDLLLSILKKTTELLSLDIDMKPLDSAPLLSESLLSSTDFLPRLSALNTNDSRLVGILLPGRPVRVVRVEDWMTFEEYRLLSSRMTYATSSMEQLQLQLTVDNRETITQLFLTLTETFPSVSILGIQMKFPRPQDVTWQSLGDILSELGHALSRSYSLSAFSLAVSPDPSPPADNQPDGRRRVIDFEGKTEEMGKAMVTKHGSTLRRVELRWHGWTIDSSNAWTPINQEKLLRRSWSYAETRDHARPPCTIPDR
ncbi:hypothetical protein SCP_0307350 [Sparassis crispa]|uniref:F-box domain-containing protein n=1 Tax=Sparassis crispa TaxID=139825 RepID=A0A401GFS0_9APHY|nr:hypothetical protein SCP_0307350 [Sparassis crispa]GBE81012.1 hypothetical protein SCP_0307350 [Sparassis crispa]